MRFIALKHLRRKGGGPRIEKGSEFSPEETTVEDLEGVARPVEEEEEHELTREELYERAKRMNIRGRSEMTKEELAAALEDPENRKAWRKAQKEEGRSK